MKKYIILIYLGLMLFFSIHCAKERKWQEVKFPGICIGNVVWTGTQFVAMGEDRLLSRYFLNSADGVTWTSQAIILNPMGTGNIYVQTFKWINNHYVVLVTFNNYNTLLAYTAFSTDGISWTQIPATTDTQKFKDIVWDSSKYIAVGEIGSISTSTDLINWTKHSLSSSDLQFNEIYYVNNRLFARDNSSNKIYKSTDGIAWQIIDFFLADNMNQRYFFFANNKYIAVGYSGDIYTSTDTVTWTNRMFLGPNLRHLIWGSEDYVGVVNGSKGSMEIWSSKDLSFWRQYVYKPTVDIITDMFSYTSRFFTGVAYNGNRYVISGVEGFSDYTCRAGVILTSP